MSENKNLEHYLSLLLSIKFEIEDKLKEAIENDKDIFEIDGKKYSILEGLVEAKVYQNRINEIIDEEIMSRNIKIPEEIEGIEIIEIEEDELDIESEVDVTDEIFDEIEKEDAMQKELNELGI